VLLGAGQFCTNPGLVLGIAGPDWDAFVASAGESIGKAPAGTMLHSGIAAAYARGVESVRNVEGVAVLAAGEGKSDAGAQPLLATVSGERFLAEPTLAQEVFGPFSLLVCCESLAQMVAIAESLEGQLTATIHFASSDTETIRELLPKLTALAGRVLANSFPTGVEVSTAMMHGGPFPATTDSRWTSVGAMALERWLRPVCWQGFPEELLPPQLQATNPLNIPRRVDGAIPRQ
jgi:2,5-dioxopentanoate dehydrogenase